MISYSSIFEEQNTKLLKIDSQKAKQLGVTDHFLKQSKAAGVSAHAAADGKVEVEFDGMKFKVAVFYFNESTARCAAVIRALDASDSRSDKIVYELESKYKKVAYKTAVAERSAEVTIWMQLDAPKTKKSGYGIKVTSSLTRKSQVFTSTSRSDGPWRTEADARNQVMDLGIDLTNEDDLKHPTFTIVKV